MPTGRSTQPPLVTRLRGCLPALAGALAGCLLGGCLQLTYEVRVHEDLSADAEYRMSMDTGFLSMLGDREQEAREKLKAHAAERGWREASGRSGGVISQRRYRRVEEVPGFASFTGLGEPDAPLFSVERGFFRDVYRVNAPVDLSRADFESLQEDLEKSIEGVSALLDLLSQALSQDKKETGETGAEEEDDKAASDAGQSGGDEQGDFGDQFGKAMESLGGMLTSELMKTVLQKVRFRVVLHLPFPAQRHNATEATEEGKVLRWVLEPGKNHPLSLEAVVFKPLNVAGAAILGLIVLAAAGKVLPACAAAAGAAGRPACALRARKGRRRAPRGEPPLDEEASPPDAAAPPRLSSGPRPLEDVGKECILQALAEAGGNVSRAAKTLGISRDTLRYRMKKFGFKDEGAG